MRKSISTLLIVSIILALMAIQQASSQTFTTTTVSTGTNTVISYTDTISPTERGQYCWYTYETLNVTSAGSQYSGSFTTDKKVTFFMMTEKQYQNREEGSLCGGGRPTSLLEVDHVNSYSFNWTAPAEGTYYFLFDDRHVGEGFTISFALWQQFTTTVSNIYTLESLTSASTPITQEQPSPFLFGQNSPVILGIIVLLVIGGVGGLALRSRHKPVKSQLSYCTICRAKLPADAGFCWECGHPVKATT